jgi:hypothetical protein
VVYAALVCRRIRTQTAYEPELEDWMFHALLPLAAYLILTISAFAALAYSREALFGVGAAVLLLLFIGIHNAWDAILYQVTVVSRREVEEEEKEEEDAR